MKHSLLLVGLSLASVSYFSVTSAAQQHVDLSVPMAELLYPALTWQKKSGIAEKCLMIGRLNPQKPDALYLLDIVDLYGDWYAATGKASWDFRAILTQAGYSQSTLPLKDLGVVLEGQQADGPDGGIEGWLKRSGDTIRLVLISHDTEIGDDEHASPKVGPTTYQVFISSITPLQPIANAVLGNDTGHARR
jgi:hypothetical protein